jgi:tRNA U34 5-methylaminomethyl-2-thiouridine-forming methyltransferase MnmC
VKREIILTSDGSKTIFLPELNENYHSGHGALQEAIHVFIRNGLNTLDRQELSVFEVGFGTGLNAYLTMLDVLESGKKVKYSGIEAFPVSSEMIKELNYPDSLQGKLETEFYSMHELGWEKEHELIPGFHFTRIHDKIQNLTIADPNFDLIYFDAFGPRAQGEMWEMDVLEKVTGLLKPEGVLVTYCARGQFKRDLRSLGLEVQSLPGPPGKREMTRAVKKGH